MVYVADPAGRRVQVFTIQGKYVSQVAINEEGPARQSAVALAFSPDAEQRFLYVADVGNSQIVFVERKTLNPIGFIGDPGDFPGQFRGLHDIAVDPSGTVYTAEVSELSRFQRFPVAPPEAAVK
jgi:DNA-binding beta-propeller fold protein YncE